ncbi:sensor domain-containing diguanylate cyclase [Serpentinimonas barnesii]|uniref:sensor domain-containing diguanylate cyclase n=1 Tax=Serpentinimonas barnesii TaxID=1458427 RepID=UPI0005F09AC3|nr:sensor domain-containing diguanylate cyclase [Serpentinimonas barnesii]
MSVTAPAPRLHWIVTTHWVVRSLAYPCVLIFLAIHLWEHDPPLLAWLLLAVQFLLYPHLVYLRARRAGDPRQAEIQNLWLDSFLFGAWAAWLGFPAFISLTLFIGSTVNSAIFRGVDGILWAIGLFAAGALLGGTLAGWPLQPQEENWVMLLSALGLSIYLMGIGVLAHQRTLALRQTRESLKVRESELQALNSALSERLHDIERLQVELREQAIRDPLTGLFNRRYLQSTLQREWARCQRERAPLCVALLDIDHFKQINERYGHGAGDQVLVRLAQLLSDSIRREDLACRYGGEEFLLLLPGMGVDEAYERAQGWRQAFAALEIWVNGSRLNLSLSVGVAVAPMHASEPEMLIHQADLALYAAKAQGRNRVVLAEPCQASP